jgi:hypothetical protein
MRIQTSARLSFRRAFIVFVGIVAAFVFEGCGAPHLVSLSVAPGRTSIALGETAKFSVAATYSDGTTEDVTGSATWSTLNSSIATVNAGGVASPVAVGTATIVANALGKSGTASLVVSKATLKGIAVSSPAAPIALGQSAQLQAQGTYSDNSVADITDLVSWSAAQPSVATITATGLAVSKSVGTTQVTASLNSVNASGQITVSTAVLASIAVGSKDASVPLGASEQFRAIGTNTDGTTTDLTTTASWTSSVPSVVSINAAGLGTTKAVGGASISAAVGGINGVATFNVSPAALVSISVSAKNSSLPLGSTEQLTATGTYTDATTKDITGSVTWTSSAPGVVSVSSGGAAMAKSVGAGGVSATSSNIAGSTTLNVSNAALVSIAVSAKNSSLPVGSTEQLTATGKYTDGTTKDITGSVTWTSSAPGVVSVSSGGTAMAKSVGAGGVSATSSNIAGSTTLNVSNAALVSIAVSAKNSSLPVGSTEQLTATGKYTDGTTKDITTSVMWASSSPGVFSVSSGGAVVAKAVGSAGASATSATVTGSTNLNVSAAALVGISISAASESVPLGYTLQLSAIGTLTDGTTHDLTSSVNWTSSSPEVLRVRGAGLVAGLAIGAAGVTASSGSISGVKNLDVSAPVLSSIQLAPAGPTVPLGGSLQLTITGTFSDGSTQDVTQQVTWNIDTPTIATITSGGVVSGQQVGTTGVEASLNGLQASDTVTVQPLLSVAYFDATSGVDSTIRVTNPGTTGHDLCAMVYIFDHDQQMSECCGCLVSQDGLMILSLKKDLLSNPLTGVASTSGTVMVVSAQQQATSACNAAAMTPAGTVVAWATHLPQSGTLSTAETPFSTSPLSVTLSSSIQAQCSFIQQLGSGQGLCGCGSGLH